MKKKQFYSTTNNSIYHIVYGITERILCRNLEGSINGFQSHTHRIAAIATNTGQMVYEYCNPEYPVPIIHFHDFDDPICPYEGGENEQVVVPSVDTVMAIWRGVNNCSSIPDTILNENGIIGKKWASLDGKSDIILYTIEGWGHNWPRIAEPGIDATDVMWDFLKLHTRSIETSIEENDMHSMLKNFILYQNYPNPFNPLTSIKYKQGNFRKY